MHVNKFYDAKNQERNNSLAVKNRLENFRYVKKAQKNH